MLSLRTLLFQVALAVLLVAQAGGATLSVSPVKLHLPPGKNVVTLTVTNTGDTPATMQIESFRWDQKNGADALDKTEDILAVPPLFSLPPHKSQTIRAAIVVPRDGAREMNYRLFFSDITTVEGIKNAIGIRMRLSLPLFVEPEVKKSALAWSARRSGANDLVISLKNGGNVHTQVRNIALCGAEGDGSCLAKKKLADYVLPGRERSWTFPLEKSPPAAVKVVADTTEAGKEEIVIPVDFHVVAEASDAGKKETDGPVRQ